MDIETVDHAAHVVHQLTPIALVTMAALLCGLALIRLRQPAVVGYIVAGIALGPTGLKLVNNTENVQLLAELGVIMLLFIIGMEINIRSFKSVMKTALTTATLQIATAFGAFWAVGQYFDWGLGKITVFAFATALSSTAVAIKILEETNDLKTPVGRTTVSVLVAQDLAVIPMLLIVGAFGALPSAGESTGLDIALKLAVSMGLLVLVSYALSRKERVILPLSNWILSRSEIIPLAAMGFCFTWATLSGAMGLSTAYGAFLAGLIVGNSNMRAAVHEAAEPIQAILLMVFFLSIGLLIDVDYIHRQLETGADGSQHRHLAQDHRQRRHPALGQRTVGARLSQRRGHEPDRGVFVYPCRRRRCRQGHFRR